jgi:hypothetical protein
MIFSGPAACSRLTDSQWATAAKRVKATYPSHWATFGPSKQAGATRKGASVAMPVAVGDSFDDSDLVRKDSMG